MIETDFALKATSLPNKRLMDESGLSRFMAENGEDFQRLGLTPFLVYASSTYVHTSIDMQDDGHIRCTEAKVPDGMVYVDFSDTTKTDQ